MPTLLIGVYSFMFSLALLIAVYTGCRLVPGLRRDRSFDSTASWVTSGSSPPGDRAGGHPEAGVRRALGGSRGSGEDLPVGRPGGALPELLAAGGGLVLPDRRRLTRLLRADMSSRCRATSSASPGPRGCHPGASCGVMPCATRSSPWSPPSASSSVACSVGPSWSKCCSSSTDRFAPHRSHPVARPLRRPSRRRHPRRDRRVLQPIFDLMYAVIDPRIRVARSLG